MHKPLGHSGLKAAPLWLGTMMFGDRTDALSTMAGLCARTGPLAERLRNSGSQTEPPTI